MSGTVVACQPGHVAEVTGTLNALPWAEVHYGDSAGRLVVVLEAADVDQGMQRVEQLRRLPGVLNVELAECWVDAEP